MAGKTLPSKRTPQCLRALGRDDLPVEFDLTGRRYRHVQTFKHDFFAATGLYADAGEPFSAGSECESDEVPTALRAVVPGQVVLKIGRRTGFLGLPLGWVGGWLTRQEATQLQAVSDLPGVPRLLGLPSRDALVRQYVPGHPLSKGEKVSDGFFPRLADLLQTLHRRGRAYVDLEKPENVLVGEDGQPYLVDFQISWPWPLGWVTRSPLGRWLECRLQQGDLYHLRKLRRRFRPDQLSPAELEESYRRPWPVRLHQRLTRPLTRLRRWVLAKVDPARRGRRGRRGEHLPV